MGSHGVGERNENGERLCDFCDMNGLSIAGTLVPHKTIHKHTGVSPDCSTRNQIDHTLINKKFRSSVWETRVCREADIARDHYLVKTPIKLKLRKIPRNDQQWTRYEETRRCLCLKLSNRYHALEVEEPKEESDNIECMNSIMDKAYNDKKKRKQNSTMTLQNRYWELKRNQNPILSRMHGSWSTKEKRYI